MPLTAYPAPGPKGPGAGRPGLLALAVAFSAGIHAALVPEHLRELPPLGYAFAAAAAVGATVALGLAGRPHDPRLRTLAGLFCSLELAGWALFVTVAVPGFGGTPERIEPIAVVAKLVELAGVVLAFARPVRVDRKELRLSA